MRKTLDSSLRGDEIIVGNSVVIAIDCETADEINDVLGETPSSALSYLKAQWQAEAIEDALDELRYCGACGESWQSELEQVAIGLRTMTSVIIDKRNTHNELEVVGWQYVLNAGGWSPIQPLMDFNESFKAELINDGYKVRNVYAIKGEE